MSESNYKSLIVWQKAISLTKEIYKKTSSFPKEEIYWLTNQMRRSVVSIPSNIAEWNQRQTQKEYRNFLYIAKWSCSELETQIIIAKELFFINEDNANILLQKVNELLKMLAALIASMKTKC